MILVGALGLVWLYGAVRILVGVLDERVQLYARLVLLEDALDVEVVGAGGGVLSLLRGLSLRVLLTGCSGCGCVARDDGRTQLRLRLGCWSF